MRRLDDKNLIIYSYNNLSISIPQAFNLESERKDLKFSDSLDLWVLDHASPSIVLGLWVFHASSSFVLDLINSYTDFILLVDSFSLVEETHLGKTFSV